VTNNNNTPEKITILILSALLLAGSLILYIRHSRPFNTITVRENGIKEELTVEEVRDRIKEARRVDINTATAGELTVIPGIGETMSRRIVEYRRDNGEFTSPEGLLEIKGIGPAKLEKMREYIKI
jgi:competence ComEA-like helix-hairpin-helix protein